jgi:FKBP-type peptidyl-prolyl cis-trans isomerase FkpA
MKTILITLLACITLTLTSCVKDNTSGCQQSLGNPQATTAEIATVQAYLTSQGITSAVQHSSGMFYTIIDAGTGATPGQCNNVSVRYTGKLTNGSIFDQALTPVTFPLSNLITGWRIGIPLIKVGGTVRLFIPPSLGYGNRAVGSIPANSVLVFDIDLVAVQ